MKAEFFFHYYRDSPQLKFKKKQIYFLSISFYQMYKLYILKYTENGKFLSIFIIYFKI